MSILDNATNMYNRMPNGSKDYFSTMMAFSSQNPERLQKVLRHPNMPINHMMVDDVVLYNSVRNLHHMGTTEDQAKVNQFFTNDSVVRAMHHGLDDKFEQNIFGNVSIPALQAKPMQQNTQVQSHNYKVTEPQLYQRRLHQGVNLLNNLSPAGRHYFLSNVNAANKDLKHYNHLEYSDSSDLTSNELEEKQRLNTLSGSGQSALHVGQSSTVQQGHSLEQDEIDAFMKNDVTQSALGNHDMYDTVYQMNKRNRILAENRSEDAKDIDPFGRTNSVQQGNHAQSRMIYDKEHHVGFKVGSLVAVTAHHLTKPEMKKHRMDALLNDNTRTKQLSLAFKNRMSPKSAIEKPKHVIRHSSGPTLTL